MIYLINAPFILDFIATATLFVLCFLTVIGAKVVLYQLLTLFPNKKQAQTPLKTVRAVSKKPIKRRLAKPIRSIEINPEEVDRIYMKKIS